MLADTTTQPASVPPAPPSGPMPGRLTMEERVRRSELLERATRQREAHALDKATWTKVWKRRDEYFAELIARLTREAGTGLDEGAQLSIPGTDEASPAEAPIEVLSGRWGELCRVDPPRIAAWTREEAALSPQALALLALLRPEESDEEAKAKPRKRERKALKRGDLPELLGCSESAAIDALAELLCFQYAEIEGEVIRADEPEQPELLLLPDSWNENDDPGLKVLEALDKSEAAAVSVEWLQLEMRLPRRAVLSILGSLARLGAIEGVPEGWRRQARVAAWEKLVLEALGRLKSGSDRWQLKRALGGCIDPEWTLGALLEAGVLRCETSDKAWKIVPEGERQPLTAEEIQARLKKPWTGKEKRAAEQLARDTGLQLPTVRRACEELQKQGWLVKAKTPGDWHAGPWYERAGDKAPKGKGGKAPAKASKGKAPAKASKSKAAPKAAKPAKKDKPTRALGDVIDGVLRAWEGWLIEEQLLAKVREEMPLNAQPSERDWKGIVTTMLAQGRIERREEGGQTLYRTSPPAAPAVDWRRERQAAVAHIAEQHKAGLPIGGDPPGTPRTEVLSYLEGAGALARGPRGWDFELSCEIDEARVSEGVWRTGLDFLLDQIEESTAANGGVGPTIKAMAELLEAPLGLVADLVAEMATAAPARVREISRELGAPTLQVLPSPKGKGKKKPAQDRTPPLFEGVEPAPARDIEEMH